MQRALLNLREVGKEKKKGIFEEEVVEKSAFRNLLRGR